MNDLTGYTFSPDLASRFRSSLNSPTGSAPLSQNVGQALQVLSLHLPSFVGGAPIAPDALLRPSHAFTPDAAVRGMTTGSPAAPSLPAPAQPAPSAVDQAPLSVFQPSMGGGPAAGAMPPAAPQGPAPQAQAAAPTPLPSFTFGGEAQPMPDSGAGGSAGGDVGGANAALLNLLNGIMRGSSGAGFGSQ